MKENDRERGWVEVPGLLSMAECEEILVECDRIVSDPTDRHHRDKPASGTRHLEALDERIELVGELVGRSQLTEVIADWYRIDDAPLPTKVGLRSPQPGFGGQDLHRDAVEGSPIEQPVAVTAIVALVPFTERNGGTRFVPGSHITGQPAAQFRGRRSSPDEVALTADAGTAFVFNGHCLHAGGDNRSESERPAIQIAWQLQTAFPSF